MIDGIPRVYGVAAERLTGRLRLLVHDWRNASGAQSTLPG